MPAFELVNDKMGLDLCSAHVAAVLLLQLIGSSSSSNSSFGNGYENSVIKKLNVPVPSVYMHMNMSHVHAHAHAGRGVWCGRTRT